MGTDFARPDQQVSSINTPEKFIIDSAMRHQAVGGNKIHNYYAEYNNKKGIELLRELIR